MTVIRVTLPWAAWLHQQARLIRGRAAPRGRSETTAGAGIWGSPLRSAHRAELSCAVPDAGSLGVSGSIPVALLKEPSSAGPTFPSSRRHYRLGNLAMFGDWHVSLNSLTYSVSRSLITHMTRRRSDAQGPSRCAQSRSQLWPTSGALGDGLGRRTTPASRWTCSPMGLALRSGDSPTPAGRKQPHQRVTRCQLYLNRVVGRRRDTDKGRLRRGRFGVSLLRGAD
jgi:hypothetical protein